MQVAIIDATKIGRANEIREVCIGPGAMPIEEFVAIARYGAKVAFSPEYVERVTRSRALADKFLEENRVIYGLTTGFGDNVRKIIPQDEAIQLQVNIIRSHAVSVGNPLPAESVRAVWLMQLLSLGRGYSGIRMETLSLIAECLNRGITPHVPQDGSVQYLAIEAQTNLVLMGEGKAWYKDKLMSGLEALKEAGLEKWTPACKEGLSLTNGANSATGVSALALYDCMVSSQTADIAAAMAYEALKGTILGCDERLNSVKFHSEQWGCAANIRNMLSDSKIMEKNINARVQDPLVLRSVPAAHGAAKRFIKDCAKSIFEEMASCSDNPILWPDSDGGLALMGGNFDSTYATGSADILCMVSGHLAKYSERRTDKLTNRYFSGFPAFLAENPGVDNGYMIVQYTAAGLLNEIRGLCVPATVDSIPTCANWEDPVSMGWWAAKKAKMVARKLSYVIGIELMTTARAFDVMQEERKNFSTVTSAVHQLIRRVVPPVEGDRHFGPDIENTTKMVVEGKILKTTEKIIGTLNF